MSMQEMASIKFDSKNNLITCQGEWTLAQLPHLENAISQLNDISAHNVTLDGSAVSKIDSAGAWLLTQFLNKISMSDAINHFESFAIPQQKLLDLVTKYRVEADTIPYAKDLSWLEKIGKTSVTYSKDFYSFLAFVGKLGTEFLLTIKNPATFRWKAFMSIIESAGFQALMIIALLSCMIGVVITYQMGLQLKTYGANIFIVDLLGLAILREFAPLITAIMVAGRTGSAFTAQLGTMKLNQEIDALNTMGVSPASLLFLPRVIGLTLVLPLLTMWADIFGIVGGMIMSNNMLDISWADFLNRFHHVVSLRSFLIGIGKAPVFALIISAIGCFEGNEVELNADSIGKQTTKSVVLSIFFIIIADAAFSIIFSKLKL
ncbi:MAG: ABC transporter permease [Gammaproteobacteria bacterium]|nr:ABC transporter permease [Gammaproteobacteria bacterium]